MSCLKLMCQRHRQTVVLRKARSPVMSCRALPWLTPSMRHAAGCLTCPAQGASISHDLSAQLVRSSAVVHATQACGKLLWLSSQGVSTSHILLQLQLRLLRHGLAAGCSFLQGALTTNGIDDLHQSSAVAHAAWGRGRIFRLSCAGCVTHPGTVFSLR
jgi:hypothetical protein